MNLQTQKQSIPWAKRKEIGFFNALWKTIKQVLFKPGEFFDNLEIKDSYSEPFLFYFIVAVGAGVIGIISQELLTAALLHRKPISPSPTALFLRLLIIVLGLYISSAISHLGVLLFRGKGGFKGTFNVFAYEAATSVFNIIPFIGALIFGVWCTVVGVIGFKRIHKLSTIRAVFAYFIIPIILIIPLMAAIAIPNLLRARVAANEAGANATVRTIVTAIETFKAAEDRYPADELELKYAKPPYLKQTYNNQTIQGYNYSVSLDIKEGYQIIARPLECGSTGVKIFQASTGGAITQEDCKK